MATVTTSIGQGTSHDETAAISAVSGAGPWTVTIAANSSVNGDALWDEHATPRKYLITAGGGTTSLTVADHEGIGGAPDNSGTSASEIKRYYNGTTPLADWETDLEDTNVYGVDDAIGECYNDANFDEKIVMNGGSTPGLTSTTLSVAINDRHDGTAGTGARLVIGSSGYVLQTSSGATPMPRIVEWLEVDSNGVGYSGVYLTTGGGSGHQGTARNMICHDNVAGTSSIRIGSAFSDVLNCICYDASGIGIEGISNSNILNNTAHNSGSDGIEISDVATSTYKNNMATDSSSADYSVASPANATVDHNLASDTTASGTGSINSAVTVDQFVLITPGSEDLHLKSGAAAIDAGDELGTTPTGVNIDIDGIDRTVIDNWDMGAHEFVAAGGGNEGAAMYHHLQNIGAY